MYSTYGRNNGSLLNDALVKAAYDGNAQQVANLLKQGVDINYQEPNGNKLTPLQASAKHGHLEVMKALISAGANLDLGSGYYNGNVMMYESHNGSALHIAAYAGQVEAVKLLLDSGAMLDLLNFSRKKTPLCLAFSQYMASSRADYWLSPTLSQKEALRKTMKLLLERGANIAHLDNKNQRWGSEHSANLECIFTLLNEIETEKRLKALQESLVKLQINTAQNESLSKLENRCRDLEAENAFLKLNLQSVESQLSLIKKDVQATNSNNNLQQGYNELKAENDRLKMAIKKLDEQLEQLKAQHQIMALETNNTQKEMLEVQEKLKHLQITDVRDKYKDKEKEIIKVQTVLRGFLARKKYPVAALKEAHVNELKSKMTEIGSKLMEAGKYSDLTELLTAAKSNHWHRVAQIIRDIPEKEFNLKDGRVLKY